MTPLKRRRRRDAIDQALEYALRLGDFIDYGAAWSFITELEEVAEQVEQLLPEESERAIKLYETFIAGCYEKADEIDDSSGNLGMFVEKLFCGWIKARQAAHADGEKTAEKLLGWMGQERTRDDRSRSRFGHVAISLTGVKACFIFLPVR